MMESPSAGPNDKKARELKRKAQLREAQRRLRQRKTDAMNDATSEIELLRKQLAEAHETIARLNPQNHSHEIDNLQRQNLSYHQIGVDSGTRSSDANMMDDQLDIGSSTLNDRVIDQSMSPCFDGLFPGSSEATPDAFFLAQFDDPSKEPIPQILIPAISAHQNEQIWSSADTRTTEVWPLGYTAVADDSPPQAPPLTFSVPAPNPDLRLVRQPAPATVRPLRPSTFSKRLWRRCAELALRLLSDTKEHQAAIERAFGNYFGHFSPTRVARALSLALMRDSYGELEYHNYPRFQFNQQALLSQNFESASLTEFVDSDPDGDPYMTPRDIEKYFLSNGQLSQTLDSSGNVVTQPCQFDFQGKSWILEENKLVHGILHQDESA